MKPLQYLFLGIAKPIGPIWFFILPVWFRKYARNVVYNYVLQNEKRDRLKRLWERNPVPYGGGSWTTKKGAIWYRKVGVIKFWLVFWVLWIWLDDDSVSDTYDDGHCRTFIDGERKNDWQAYVFGRWLDIPMEEDSKAFDYGDDITPRFRFVPALIWQLRNTSRNFRYWYNY